MISISAKPTGSAAVAKDDGTPMIGSGRRLLICDELPGVEDQQRQQRADDQVNDDIEREPRLLRQQAVSMSSRKCPWRCSVMSAAIERQPDEACLRRLLGPDRGRTGETVDGADDDDGDDRGEERNRKGALRLTEHRKSFGEHGMLSEDENAPPAGIEPEARANYFFRAACTSATMA